MIFLDKMRKLFKQSTQTAGSSKLSAAELLEYISMQLQNFANDLQQHVEAASAGRDGYPRSVIEYVIKDRSGAELQTEWGDVDYISHEQIIQCPGYLSLIAHAQQLNIKLTLSEESCLEYTDEDRNRYIVTLTGWG